MATVTGEQSFIIQEEALLNKTPVSAQIQDTIDALSSNDAMEAEECRTYILNKQKYRNLSY